MSKRNPDTTRQTEVKLKMGQSQMVVPDDQAERLIILGWSPVSLRTKVETDAQARRAALKEQVIVRSFGFGCPALTLPAGTSTKQSRQMINAYRKEWDAYGKLHFSCNWV